MTIDVHRVILLEITYEGFINESNSWYTCKFNATPNPLFYSNEISAVDIWCIVMEMNARL